MGSIAWPTCHEVAALLDQEPAFATYVREQSRLSDDEAFDDMIRTPAGWEDPFGVAKMEETLRQASESELQRFQDLLERTDAKPAEREGVIDHPARPAYMTRYTVLELFGAWYAKRPVKNLQEAVALFREWQAKRRGRPTLLR